MFCKLFLAMHTCRQSDDRRSKRNYLWDIALANSGRELADIAAFAEGAKYAAPKAFLKGRMHEHVADLKSPGCYEVTKIPKKAKEGVEDTAAAAAAEAPLDEGDAKRAPRRGSRKYPP